ncbi:MAG: hypothetical protein Q9227_006973 [Pyrenula ochraceoflavens]
MVQKAVHTHFWSKGRAKKSLDAGRTTQNARQHKRDQTSSAPLPAASGGLGPEAPDTSKDPFPPYPSVDNITTTNLRGTRLYGWKGCTKADSDIITEAYDDFYYLANQKALYQNIDWTDQPVKDFFGPSTGASKITDDRRTEIQQIFAAAQQVWHSNIIYHPGWSPFPYPYSLWYEVRCSGGPDGDGDPDDVCGDKNRNNQCRNGQQRSPNSGDMQAWSDPTWSNNPFGKRWPQTTFCNAFFNDLTSLGTTVTNMQRRSTNDQNNLANWDNRARCFFHEVTHQVYFMNTPDKGPNVIDLQISYRSGGATQTEDAYGPMNAKRVRNYPVKNKGGYYTQINADNYAFLALAKYVQGKIGRYPNAPSPGTQGLTQAPRDPDGKPLAITASTDQVDDDPEAVIGGPFIDNPSGYKIPGCFDVSPTAANVASALASSSSSSHTTTTTTTTNPPTTTTTQTPAPTPKCDVDNYTTGGPTYEWFHVCNCELDGKKCTYNTADLKDGNYACIKPWNGSDGPCKLT